MCGLTGLVLHPDTPAALRADTLHPLFSMLLAATESRGHHATGIAAMTATGAGDTIKRAVPARRFVNATEVERWITGHMEVGTTMLMGHTRYATQPNAGVDACAHPFTFGAVTGAHNGIITNWHAIEGELRRRKYAPARRGFTVDSEAAFALLDMHHAKPEKALNALQGYYALTWMRAGAFYVARNGAPLTVAYVRAWRTLVYNSERRVLAEALGAAGVNIHDATAVTVYDPTEGEVYRWTPATFDTDAAHVEKVGTFLTREAPRAWNSARPTLPTGGTSTTTTVARYTGTRAPWEATDADDTTEPVIRTPSQATKRGSDIVNVNGALVRRDSVDMNTLTMRRELRDALATIQALRGEVGRMREVLDAVPSARALYADLCTRHTMQGQRATASAQGDLQLFSETGTCALCGWRASAAAPLVMVGENMVHAECAAMDGRNDPTAGGSPAWE